MTRPYDAFLAEKRRHDPATGLTSLPALTPALFDFQRDITGWALRRGRAALFAGTGLGKSLMELAWADAIHRETGKDILHLAPLAVTAQMVREAEKFGLIARQVRTQGDCIPGTSIIVTFRKPGENPEPVSGCFDQWIGEGPGPDRAKYTTPTDGRNWYSIEVWQRYASPVWSDIDATRTLQYRAGRDEKDEVHISPLQLDVIERCIDLWSNPGDTVLTPFLGIGSEVFCAVKMGRRGVGFELKPSYFVQAVRNLREVEQEAAGDLFVSGSAA